MTRRSARAAPVLVAVEVRLSLHAAWIAQAAIGLKSCRTHWTLRADRRDRALDAGRRAERLALPRACASTDADARACARGVFSPGLPRSAGGLGFPLAPPARRASRTRGPAPPLPFRSCTCPAASPAGSGLDALTRLTAGLAGRFAAHPRFGGGHGGLGRGQEARRCAKVHTVPDHTGPVHRPFHEVRESISMRR